MTLSANRRSTLPQQASAALVLEFPEVDGQTVDDAVSRAMSGLDLFNLTRDEDALQLLVGLARHDLRLALGLDQEVARLDPERHNRQP